MVVQINLGVADKNLAILELEINGKVTSMLISCMNGIAQLTVEGAARTFKTTSVIPVEAAHIRQID